VGGIATFVGTARRWSQGQEVRYLEFEAYEPLALRELEAICQEAIDKFGLLDAQVLHRVGKVGLGEIAVAIACAAAHRSPAFDGCRYVIDELKQRAPIWKRETTLDGAVWVNSTP
jgi:molybdopterin synthase catalytic subunit